MSTGSDDKASAAVAIVSGALIGVAVTLLVVRMQRNRALRARADERDYYDGEELFI